MPNINDTVRLTVALPQEGLSEGAVGVVVAKFDAPDEAYEVEFSDEDGASICELPLRKDQFVVLD